MSQSRPIYQDSAENFLNSFFNHPESKKTKAITDLLATNPPWPVLYHLSPQRRMILQWFDFNPKSNLLEIGAGCGAVTKTFLDKCRSVTCLELEKNRANIIKKRFSNYQNLKVISANLNRFSSKKKFDYITLIGVLEYAGRFFHAKNNSYSYSPFINMLKKTKTFLNRNGTIFIAIENKLGLKYFSGCPEDHYNTIHESINDYPHYSGIRTFSHHEIKTILKKAGFQKISFLYPFPDYKLPSQIFSKKFLAPQTTTPNPASSRQHLLDETMVAKSLLDAKLLHQFANSFLIIAK